jgi:hypothetical protein
MALSAMALLLLRAAPAKGGLVGLEVEVVADRDDDDADGRPDAEEEVLPLAGRTDLLPLSPALTGASLHPVRGADHVRVMAEGRVVPWDTPLPSGAALQGLSPGRMSGVVARAHERAPMEVGVFGIGMRDGAGARVDLARSHASIERTPPSRLESGPDARYDDVDALRIVVEEEESHDASGHLVVESVSATGLSLDTLVGPLLGPASCEPGSVGLRCLTTAPLRFVVDEVDRRHPLVESRSLRVELGGAVVVRQNGKKLQAIRVLGPRASPIGPIGRLRATLRPIVVRVAPGGAPAIGGNDAGAAMAFRAELARASAIWGQCGLTFGNAETIDVRVVDPPPPHLLSIGDDVGLPASGGEIRFSVDATRLVRAPTVRGAMPEQIALGVARALESAGFVALVSRNARIGPGAEGSVDVSVRRRDGALASLGALSRGAPVSTDAQLSVRIGSVDLSDGLQHFGDMDSAAGTLEERTLLKGLGDDDPRTIEVVVVPFFAGGGRIGESFIGSDLSSVRNVVILDRAGIRATRSSLTLAHELGHVLLDMPGHPDDYGIDTPTQLMDSDASDASPYGPRRLTLEECARMVRESGPHGRVPLLTDWPLGPLTYGALPR